MSQVYEINKGVMKSIEFKGLKAQYIAYLAVGLVALLLLFAIGYMIGLPTYLLLAMVLLLGYLLITTVTKYSHKYGEHGLMKEAAYKRVPVAIICRGRKMFLELKTSGRENDSSNSVSDDSGSDNTASTERRNK